MLLSVSDVKLSHLLQCALCYYDNQANVGSDAAVSSVAEKKQQNKDTCSAFMSDLLGANQCV